MGRPLLHDEVPVGPCKVRALFSWSGESPQDLGFVEGDIIEVLNNGDGDWWTGKLKRNKLVGVFPRNFVEYVDPNQKTMSAARSRPRHTQPASEFAYNLDLDDLQISDPPERSEPTKLRPIDLGNSQSSQRSTKSALEILDDVCAELNEDLKPMPPPHTSKSPYLGVSGHGSFAPNTSNHSVSNLSANLSAPSSPSTSSSHVPNGKGSTPAFVPISATAASSTPTLGASAFVPQTSMPAPNKSGANAAASKQTASKSSALTGPPIVKPTTSKSSALTGPPITKPTERTGLAISKAGEEFPKSASQQNSLMVAPAGLEPFSAPGSPALSTEVPFDPKAPFEPAGITQAEPVPEPAIMAGEQTPPERKSFLQRLFPKNSQLRRHASHSSQKSSKSVKAKMKSFFSFAPRFEPDDSIYPSNMMISAPKRISTPPRTPNVVSTFNVTAPRKSITATAPDSKESQWINSRRDLYRAQTLTQRDLQRRRQELELQGVNCDNLVEHLQPIDFHDYRLESFESVDQAVLHMSTWPQLMTPSVFASSRIGRHFSDPAERVRAVFLLCATRIQHVDQTPQPNNVMHSRMATPLELARTVCDMCAALDIECRAVQGHIRTAPPDAEGYVSTPHVWNAVQINGEWRLLDCVTAAAGPIDDEEEFVNLFYFLTPPSQLIFSHVPTRQQDQFCQGSLPTASAALLPLASPAAFAYGIYFSNFWLGLTRMSDLEMAELELEVPDASKDVVAFVDDSAEYALSQAVPDSGENFVERRFRIKAFVPQHRKQSLLRIYVVPKQQAERTPASMELVWAVELRHVGGGKNNAPFTFVSRYALPDPLGIGYDLYVKEPQCRSLSGGDVYNFKIQSQPLTNTKQPSIAVQSPSGRLTRLNPERDNMFSAAVKTLEVGTWRAVARATEEDSWAPFAEWFCS